MLRASKRGLRLPRQPGGGDGAAGHGSDSDVAAVRAPGWTGMPSASASAFPVLTDLPAVQNRCPALLPVLASSPCIDAGSLTSVHGFRPIFREIHHDPLRVRKDR
ncbi:hypothetical protein BS78_03G405500 [Paspalum vaginatum]|nr:hypothetical protein BS78_03G405500 [Paspalum vaginatum]